VVLVALRLRRRRLLLGRLATALLATAAGAGCAHAFAAVHPAVAVPVGAAAAPHVRTLVLVMLPALRLARLVAGMACAALLLVLGMVLVLRGRRRLSGGRRGERKRDRGNENLHLKSPEAFDEREIDRSFSRFEEVEDPIQGEAR
jgi:hypothetical protein